MKSFSFIALIILSVAALLGGCRKTASDAKSTDVDYYTCTMHPAVRSQDADGHCPICGMHLVPVKKQLASEDASGANAMDNMPGMQHSKAPMGEKDAPREFTIPLDRQQLIGVTFATVEKRSISKTLRAVGAIEINKLKHWDYVARVEGYVGKLFVESRGDPVKSGQPLLTLYSPDLLATQREYIEALRISDEAKRSEDATSQAHAAHLVESARHRLSLWNLDAEQLNRLEKTRAASDTLTLSSPFDGVVLDVMINQGSRVTPGTHLIDVADLSTVWVWAEVYQEEIAHLEIGQPVTITTDAFPNQKWSGKIALIDPFLNSAQRTARVRIDLQNAGMKLRPKMYVNVELVIPALKNLAVPVNAVLPTGERNIVFVDKGAGKLEPRFIGVGEKLGDYYTVTAGLTEGERVVTSANFLIDAEAKVQGALKSW